MPGLVSSQNMSMVYERSQETFLTDSSIFLFETNQFNSSNKGIEECYGDGQAEARQPETTNRPELACLGRRPSCSARRVCPLACTGAGARPQRMPSGLSKRGTPPEAGVGEWGVARCGPAVWKGRRGGGAGVWRPCVAAKTSVRNQRDTNSFI
jgi:hypothetical protein